MSETVTVPDAGALQSPPPATQTLAPVLLDCPDTVNDGVSSRQGYAVSLEVFEGPLDLLLHLVRRHELDILDIPIAFITEKYIEYLQFVRALDLEVAGEYLVMAATLAFLKSRELLPTEPETEFGDDQGEDGVDPREELIRRLIEYERFKMAGADLDSRPLLGRDVFMRGRDSDIAAIDPGLAPISLFKLAQAYQRIVEKAKIDPTHDVEIEPVTVRQRMGQLAELLATRDDFDFIELFLTRSWSSERELRAMLVVTLMSVLEMVKLGVIGVAQVAPEELSGGVESLMVERTVAREDLLRVIGEFVSNHREPTDASDRVDTADSSGEAPSEAGEESSSEQGLESESQTLAEAGENPSEPAAVATEPASEIATPSPLESESGDSDADEVEADDQ